MGCKFSNSVMQATYLPKEVQNNTISKQIIYDNISSLHANNENLRNMNLPNNSHENHFEDQEMIFHHRMQQQNTIQEIPLQNVTNENFNSNLKDLPGVGNNNVNEGVDDQYDHLEQEEPNQDEAGEISKVLLNDINNDYKEATKKVTENNQNCKNDSPNNNSCYIDVFKTKKISKVSPEYHQSDLNNKSGVNLEANTKVSPIGLNTQNNMFKNENNKLNCNSDKLAETSKGKFKSGVEILNQRFYKENQKTSGKADKSLRIFYDKHNDINNMVLNTSNTESMSILESPNIGKRILNNELHNDNENYLKNASIKKSQFLTQRDDTEFPNIKINPTLKITKFKKNTYQKRQSFKDSQGSNHPSEKNLQESQQKISTQCIEIQKCKVFPIQKSLERITSSKQIVSSKKIDENVEITNDENNPIVSDQKSNFVIKSERFVKKSHRKITQDDFIDESLLVKGEQKHKDSKYKQSFQINDISNNKKHNLHHLISEKFINRAVRRNSPESMVNNLETFENVNIEKEIKSSNLRPKEKTKKFSVVSLQTFDPTQKEKINTNLIDVKYNSNRSLKVKKINDNYRKFESKLEKVEEIKQSSKSVLDSNVSEDHKKNSLQYQTWQPELCTSLKKSENNHFSDSDFTIKKHLEDIMKRQSELENEVNYWKLQALNNIKNNEITEKRSPDNQTSSLSKNIFTPTEKLSKNTMQDRIEKMQIKYRKLPEKAMTNKLGVLKFNQKNSVNFHTNSYEAKPGILNNQQSDSIKYHNSINCNKPNLKHGKDSKTQHPNKNCTSFISPTKIIHQNVITPTNKEGSRISHHFIGQSTRNYGLNDFNTKNNYSNYQNPDQSSKAIGIIRNVQEGDQTISAISRGDNNFSSNIIYTPLQMQKNFFGMRNHNQPKNFSEQVKFFPGDEDMISKFNNDNKPIYRNNDSEARLQNNLKNSGKSIDVKKFKMYDEKIVERKNTGDSNKLMMHNSGKFSNDFFKNEQLDNKHMSEKKPVSIIIDFSSHSPTDTNTISDSKNKCKFSKPIFLDTVLENPSSNNNENSMIIKNQRLKSDLLVSVSKKLLKTKSLYVKGVRRSNKKDTNITSKENNDARKHKTRNSTRTTNKEKSPFMNYNKEYSVLDGSVMHTSKLDVSYFEDGTKKVNQYKVLRKLGIGSFGKVKLVQNTLDNKKYAIKIIDLKKIKLKCITGGVPNLSEAEAFQKEVAVMKKLNHSNIVSLYEVIEDDTKDKVYLVIEYCKKGAVMSDDYWKSELNVRKLKEIPTKLSTEKAKKYFQDLCKGMYYLHKVAKLCHRDLKPDNLLIDEHDVCKISDFGVSEVFKGNALTSKKAGTTMFLAPEIFICKMVNAKALDIWAMGCTLYSFQFGKLPFIAEDVKSFSTQIKSDDFTIDYPEDIDSDVKELLKGMLNRDFKKRWKIDKIIKHHWVNEDGKLDLLTYDNEYIKPDKIDYKAAVTKIDKIDKLKSKHNQKLENILD